MDWIDAFVDLGNWFWGWYDNSENQNKSNAIAAAVGLLLTLLGLAIAALWFFLKLPFQKGRKQSKPEAPGETISPAPSVPVITLTLIDFQAQLDAREKAVSAKLKDAHTEDRALLQAQLEELARQRTDPEPALKQAQARIADLENRLSREGNDLGAENLDAARAALETGDYSVADDLFAEIEARSAMAGQSAARAAFARGEIAEAEVRWAAAAAHYARSVGLEPSLAALRKAGDYAERAGDYPAARLSGSTGFR
jgi:tetratricopeptide (TPR) repeat protein